MARTVNIYIHDAIISEKERKERIQKYLSTAKDFWLAGKKDEAYAEMLKARNAGWEGNTTTYLNNLKR